MEILADKAKLEEQKQYLINFWKGKFNFTENELNAFKIVRREEFIPDEISHFAYQDTPLPIMRGKTISQPTTVMLMISSLEIEKDMKVFEIGTGSGYHAAIMSKLVGNNGKIISTEVVPELVHFSKQNFRKANIKNVFVYEEDGSKGMEQEAPFDRILITAACKEFPKELLKQLRTDGIIVGPVGNQNEQEMVKGIKDKDGHLRLEFLGQFIFTPMYGKYGFET